jgi:hypothetical protein
MFYNTTIGFAMFIGRFLMIVPMVAIASSLAAKKVARLGGTFPHGLLFVGLVVGVIPIVGGHLLFRRSRRPAGRTGRDERRNPLESRTDHDTHTFTAAAATGVATWAIRKSSVPPSWTLCASSTRASWCAIP